MLETQVASARGMDEKAAQVFQFNSLIIGLLVTGVSFVAGGPGGGGAAPWWGVALFGLGFAAMFMSTLLAVMAYRVTRYEVGLGAERLRRALEYDAKERSFLVAAVRSFSTGIDENDRVIARTSSRLDGSLWLLLLGLLFLSAGATGLLVVGGH